MNPAATLHILVQATGIRRTQGELTRFQRHAKNVAKTSDIKAKLGADFVGKKNIGLYVRELDKVKRKTAQRDAFKAKLGADFDNRAFNSYWRAIDKTDRSTRKAAGSFNLLGGSAGRAAGSVGRLLPALSLATRIPVYKIAAIGTAIAAIIPPAISLVSALSPLVGLLGAIPGLAAAAAQGLGSMVLGFMGVGDAVKAAFDAQKTAAKDAGTAAKAQRASAEGVREAIRGVADAQRGLTDAHRGVRDAERSLSDAQRQTTDAQKDLNAARREAARDLIDMRLAVQGANLSEKEARVELARSIQEQSRVLSDAASSSLDIRDAELAVQRARLGLKEATLESSRTQKDYNEAQKKGVAGSDQVVAAQKSLQDAQRGVAEANRGVADAHRGVADAQRALVEATREVRNAQKAQSESASEATAGVNKLNEAMSTLPPSAQKFARFIISLKPHFDALRESAAAGLFPGLEAGIRAAMGNFGILRKAIGESSLALGELSRRFGEKLGGEDWGRDLEVQGERNVVTIQRLGTAGLSLSEVFKDIMLSAGPLVSFLTRSTEKYAAMLEKWVQTKRESGELTGFFRRTITVTKIVVDTLVNLGMALHNIGKISARVWGNDLLVNIQGAVREFRKWTESVKGSEAIERFFIRWRKRWADIVEAIGRVINRYRELRREGKSATEALTVLLGQGLTKAVEHLAETAGELAPKVAFAFVKGFLQADILGQLFIGVWFLRKIGKLGAVTRLGAGYATTFVAGFAARMAAGGGLGAVIGKALGGGAAAGGAVGGAAAGGLAARFKSVLSKIGPRLGGIGLGVFVANEIFQGMRQQFKQRGTQSLQDAFGELEKQSKGGGGLGQVFEWFAGPSDASKNAERLAGALREVASAGQDLKLGPIKNLREQLAGVRGISDTAREAFLRMLNNMAERAKNKLDLVRNEFGRLRSGAVLNVRDMRETVVKNMERIRTSIGFNSKRGRELLDENFRAGVAWIRTHMSKGGKLTENGMKEIRRLIVAQMQLAKSGMKGALGDIVEAIRTHMRRGRKVTDEGMRLIRQAFIDELSLYGDIGKKSARALVNRPQEGSAGPRGTGQNRQFTGQRGGPIDQGKPSGDTVPAMLERGEYVLNRKATSMVGRKALDAINFGAAPRFQGGGIVSLGHQLQKQGYQVGEHPAFGGVAPVHTENSYHYRNQAIDVNWPDPSVEPKKLDVLYRRLKGMKGVVELLWRVADHYDHLHVAMSGKGGTLGDLGRSAAKLKRAKLGGPDTAFKGILQSGLDRVRGAAQRRLEAVVTRVEGSEAGVVPAGTYTGPLNKNFGRGSNATIGFNQAAMLAEKAGLPGVTYAQIAIGESGLRPGAVSPDGGFGLWQMTPRVQSPQTVAAWERIGSYFNPWNNARMAKVLAGSGTGTSNYYGTGNVTNWNKHYNGPMKGLREGGLIGAIIAMATGGSVSYPLSQKGKNLGGPGAHKARALGNWQSDNAVDIGVPIGTIVKAVVAGKMGSIKGNWDGGGGQTSGIQAYLGDEWWYTHLKQIDAKTGQVMQAGERIGVSGAGNSVPHLHLAKQSGNPEIALGWPIVDPSAIAPPATPGKDGKPSKPKETPMEKLIREANEGEKAQAKKPLSRAQKRLLKGLPKKPIGKHFQQVLKLIRRSKKPKLRSEALQGLMDRIAQMEEIPNAARVAALQAETSLFGDQADRANNLSVGNDMTEIQNLLANVPEEQHAGVLGPLARAHMGLMTERQKMLFDFGGGRAFEQLDPDSLLEILDTPRWGQVGGLTQAEWLEKQLETLRILRNEHIEQERIIIERRQRIMELIAKAQKRLREVEEEMERAAKTQRRLKKTLEEIEAVSGGKAPDKARKLVRQLKGDIPDGTWQTLKQAVEGNRPAFNLREALKGEIEQVADRQAIRKRERDALETIIPAFETKRDALTTALEDEVRPALSEVQGQVAEGIRTQIMHVLPDLGVLGGQVFDVQMSLRDLGIKKILTVPRPEVADEAQEGESAELLRQMLREANLRTAVSEAAFKVFQNAPRYGPTGIPFGGEFAEGGVVPGPMGSPRVILAHGGEIVTPPGQMGEIQVNVFVEPGHDYLKDKIRVEVEQMSRAVSRAAARGLPSRGGGV